MTVQDQRSADFGNGRQPSPAFEAGVRIDDLRRAMRQAGTYDDSHVVVLEGTSAAAGQTSLPLSVGGGMTLEAGSPGIPVPYHTVLREVAVAWLSDSVPSGAWVLTIERREAGSSTFVPAATFAVGTS